MASTPPIFSAQHLWNAKLLRMMRLQAKFAANNSAFSSFQFEIGDGNPGTPANGTTDYINPLFVPTKEVSIYSFAAGDYLTFETQWEFIEGGGIALVGSTFDTGDEYLVFAH